MQQEEIYVRSTLDGSLQPSLLFRAEGKRPVLVGLHSWSYDRYNQVDGMTPWAEKYGFHLLLPQFRGPNLVSNPGREEACGSLLAKQDIIDAIDHLIAEGIADPENIFLLGGSGGGHMALMMAGYRPEYFKAITNNFDHQNLTDYWLFLTVFSLRDNRGKNLYWAANDPNSDSAVFTITPWDCDIGFGYRYGKNEFSMLDLPCYRDDYENDYIDDFALLTQYLKRDINNAKSTVLTRWQELSAEGGVLSLDSVLNRFESYRTYLEDTGAWDREMTRWPKGMVEDPDEEFQYLEDWMVLRYDWMEDRIAEVTETEADS